MSENAKNYSKICSNIGLAMLLFYAFFTLSAYAVAVVQEIALKYVSSFVAEVIYELLAAIVYFFSFSVAAFILRKMIKKMPGARPIYTSFKISKWAILAIIMVIAINSTVSYLNAVMISSVSPSFTSLLQATENEMASRPLNEIVVFFLLSILSTAVVPALCEEYLFRGGILTGLLPYGKGTAILASSFLFGMMHQNPLQILYTTLMGVIIGCIYVKTKSIWACVILHFLNNLTSVLDEFLPLITGLEWIELVSNIVVMIVGFVALLLVALKKDKESEPETNGSFGVIYDSGTDAEEYELKLPKGQKLRKFFAPTVIAFTVISIVTMLGAMLSFLGLQI